MKKDKPILFSGPMARAILEGRKTQTRRIVKFTPGSGYIKELGGHRRWHRDDPAAILGCPYGQRGDRLWVRETWTQFAAKPDDLVPENAVIDYKADYTETQLAVTLDSDGDEMVRPRWRPSIHMPRWASRLTLEVTGVRVERLQDISEADAKAEGAIFTDYGKRCFHDWQGPGPCPSKHHQQREGWSMVPTDSSDDCLVTARFAFGNLWNSLYKHRAPWESNPWVWVVEFRRIDQ